MLKTYSMPTFLVGVVEPTIYARWLQRKAAAHVTRDRRRGHTCTISLYKQLIHAAVVESEGKDAYTGETLAWNLISTYKNDDSLLGKHSYKAGFALLPTVDHVAASATQASFVICAWRTNDAKNDLSFDDFLSLCKKTLEFAGYTVDGPEQPATTPETSGE